VTTSDRAALDAAIILRARVDCTRPVPSFADCVLLNAALHLEGRTPDVRSAVEVAWADVWADPLKSRCGQPIDAAIVAPCERHAGHTGPCRAYSIEK